MSGGWAGSDRGARLPADWDERVAFVRERAGGRCERRLPGRNGGHFRCIRPGTDCDHRNRGDDHSYVNLQWLCRQCHNVKSSQEGNDAKAAIRGLRSRPKTPERHPGEIRRPS